MEKGKGIVIRFVIGHSATPGGVLDKAIDAEDAEHQDFLTLNHVEGYHQLSSKTRLPILHRYANEDLSPLLTKFLDCEWKAKAGNACVASFDWSCSGICKSVERMKIGHNSCGEGDGAVWNVDF
ncbi:Beta-1,6-galactosyltransferase GALT31A [Citrus sinensis]|uniref:Beta-1,6-galactosyltransferase GALT31A n=1 Tax=Citrus sinensis TaxID=2711 RepID=A0ACB8M971_CITSI|nr:Beta-1,6-galactosyltransferase GALT31A [Citrus sinensis]